MASEPVEAPRASLERFARPVRVELDAVEERLAVLQESLPRGDALRDLSAGHLRPVAAHLFRAGGKLLRPLLTLLAARAAGTDWRRRDAVIRGA
ncbi:MAG TPA: hypothetical protein VHE79_10360, partial [Spirochaetia bacterium]